MRKVSCLTRLMSQVQRDLGRYALRGDVQAFWAQFTQKYNAVAESLRMQNKKVTENDEMDKESKALYDELLAWLLKWDAGVLGGIK